MRTAKELYSFLMSNSTHGDCVSIKGDCSEKERFKRLSAKLVRELKKLYTAYNWEFNFIAGGPAVEGEAIIKTEFAELWICPCFKSSHGLMFRGRKKGLDNNQWVPFQSLRDGSVIDKFLKLSEQVRATSTP